MNRDPSVTRYTAGRLSPRRRAADLRRLRSYRFDVLIIGGGVTGAGAAVDAAARGLSVALVEAGDLACGTSSRSSKLIHGGLRYLEQLEFGLVREALRERGRLATRLAPHLVRPVPILVPLPAGPLPVRAARRLYFGAGLALYDGFAGLVAGVGPAAAGGADGGLATPGRGMPAHRHLSRAGAHRYFPSLREDAVAGAIRYYDGQVDDARFVATLARTAASLGAAIVPYARVVQLVRNAREVTGAVIRDESSGELITVSARTVVAATGVWSEEISNLVGEARPGLRVRASKGIHIVVPRSVMTGDAGLILRTPASVLFVLPWGGHWIIGTTDTDWPFAKDHPVASATDIEYLLDQLNPWLDRPVTQADIEGVYAGLRPLLRTEARLRRRPHSMDEQTSVLSREHAVVEPMLGLMLVAGGKFTTYRVMAADVIDRVARRLGTAVPASHTDQLPLLGADGYRRLWTNRADLARRYRLSVGVVEHLLERYGSLVIEVLDLIAGQPELARPVQGAPEYLAAEIVYAASHEGARHLPDALARRTRISIETENRGLDSAADAAQLLGQVLGWDAARRRAEVEAYRQEVAAERAGQQVADGAVADPLRLERADLRPTAMADQSG